MDPSSKVYVAGHTGLVGSAVCRRLYNLGYVNVLTASSDKLDLRNWEQTANFFAEHRPEYVFMCAAKVGGIVANDSDPIGFFEENILMEMNVFRAAASIAVKKLVFTASACAYPKHANTPVAEDALLSGELEPTNEMYALAKIAGIKLCQAYHRMHGTIMVPVMPTNLYGIGDHYGLNSSHVIPGMIRRIHEANQKRSSFVTLWGTGSPYREFLWADDLAEAVCAVADRAESSELINVSTGRPIQLWVLAQTIQKVIGYIGIIQWDATKPDGTPRRELDVKRISRLDWKPRTNLEDGIRRAYEDFKSRTHE